MPITISSKHYANEFPNGMNLENKIEVYFDRVLGCQLIPAQNTANNIKHSRFAVLHIVMSFFESIAKYREGYCKNNASKRFFKKGFELVFPQIQEAIPDFSQRDELLEKIYDDIRCGLYHASLTGTGIVITGQTNSIIEIHTNVIIMNPHRIVEPLEIYLRNYIRDLCDTKNIELREQFEARFEFDSRMSSTLISSSLF